MVERPKSRKEIYGFMDVITCYKLSPDNQDMQINPDYTVSFDRAEWIIGDFDLVAIEAGAQIAAMAEASHKGLCVGPTALSIRKPERTRYPGDWTA